MKGLTVCAGIYSGRFGTIRKVVAGAVDAAQAGSDSTDSEMEFQISKKFHKLLSPKFIFSAGSPFH